MSPWASSALLSPLNPASSFADAALIGPSPSSEGPLHWLRAARGTDVMQILSSAGKSLALSERMSIHLERERQTDRATDCLCITGHSVQAAGTGEMKQELKLFTFPASWYFSFLFWCQLCVEA